MKYRSPFSWGWFVLLLAIGSIGGAIAQPRPGGPPSIVPKPNEPLTFDASGVKIKVSLVTGNLVGPWDIAFLPGGSDLLVSESNGKLRIVQNGVLNPDPVWTAPTPKRNDVLHGLVLHPDFATNGYVYLSYMKGDDKMQTLAVSRGKLANGKLVDVREIFVADAWENAGMAIAGRMIFSPDKKLIVEVGDRDPLCCQPVDDNHVRMRAQSLDNDVGKVLRLNDDGTPAKDNPFAGRKDAKPEIYSYGHRNGYGFAYHPETGELWELEIGPMGGDEINILKPGANYGWPLVSMGRNYSGTLVSDQPFSRPGMENPRVFWVPSISPSGLMFYTGDKFGPTWKNSLFVGALSGQHLERLAFGLPGQAEHREILLAEMRLRFRDIETGPDGNIYVATEVRYGSGQPDGAILKIEPAGH
jgi:glucose/arabinose dehydrogenase